MMFAKIQKLISKNLDPFFTIDIEKLKFMVEILINITYKDRKIKSEASLVQIKVVLFPKKNPIENILDHFNRNRKKIKRIYRFNTFKTFFFE